MNGQQREPCMDCGKTPAQVWRDGKELLRRASEARDHRKPARELERLLAQIPPTPHRAGALCLRYSACEQCFSGVAAADSKKQCSVLAPALLDRRKLSHVRPSSTSAAHAMRQRAASLGIPTKQIKSFVTVSAPIVLLGHYRARPAFFGPAYERMGLAKELWDTCRAGGRYPIDECGRVVCIDCAIAR